MTDPLVRTTSNESARSRSSAHHTLSAASARAPLSRKSTQANMDTSAGEVEKGNISMPPPPKPGQELGAKYPPSSRPTEAGSMAVDEDTGTLEPSNSNSAAMRSTSSLPETATDNLSVTTSAQNGQALSPSTSAGTHGDPMTASAPSISSMPGPVTSPTSPSPPNQSQSQPRSQGGRTVRGRTPGGSRRDTASNTNSASPSADRSTAPNPNRIGTIGICALDSKARSKPSRNILNRLVGKDSSEFEVIIFGDKVILDESVENWPVCDFLISFFSDGFPLEKAIAYAKLRKPFCVNDLPMQTILWDRRMCLYILDKLGVPTPKRVEVNRDGGPVILTNDIAKRVQDLTGVQLEGSDDGRGGGAHPPAQVQMEDDNDTLVVDGRRLSKPFVEKPVSGEDHNINIYYPRSQGGGGRRLFRKVNNKSSEKDDSLVIPRAVTEENQSYIYEQFLKVENAEDVKAYTVGPDFCHAETRKSPVVDGVVKRNPNGKEIRYVTSLTPEEKTMASKIASGFGQRVCGFDLLRVEEKSFVIDVNGWSFVKDNNEYYDKCAAILRGMFIAERHKWNQNRPSPSASAPVSEDGSVADAANGESAAAATGTEKGLGIQRKGTMNKNGDDPAARKGALKSVFGSRSITQLRDSVSSAAQKAGHHMPGTRSPSGATSPLTSPPSFEKDRLPQGSLSRTPSIPLSKDDEALPPPATGSASIGERVSKLRSEENRRSISEENLEAAQDHEPLVGAQPDDAPPANLPAPASKSQWKLKGMVAVIRHADRTPKQKFKFTFHTKPFVDLLKGHREEVLLVGEAALDSVAEAVREAMTEGEEDPQKLRQLENALRRKRGLPGTKVQIKPMFKKPKDKEGGKEEKKDKEGKEEKKEKEGKDKSGDRVEEIKAAEGVQTEKMEWRENELSRGEKEKSPAEGDEKQDGATQPPREAKRSESMSEVTMSRVAAADNNLVLDKLQLVMKWGGEPTHSARYQAQDLGENMRNDLLLMNRDVLSDVSIFTSSERRVTTSAQIFAGAFLDQKDVDSEGIRIRKDLLDDSNAAKDEMDRVKKKLKGLLRKGEKAPEQFAWPRDGTPEPYLVVRNVVELMKFHRRVMRHNFAKLQSSDALRSLEKLKHPSEINTPTATPSAENATPNQTSVHAVQARWCTGEDADLFKERWEKIFNEFTDAEKVDPSKISELYDTMKFDALHNRQFLEWVFTPSRTILDELEEEERLRKLEEDEVGGVVGKEDGSGEGAPLTRTESQTARDEFRQTHEGIQPVREDKGEDAHDSASAHDAASVKAPTRTGTGASEGSVGWSSQDNKSKGAVGESKKVEKKDATPPRAPTISERLGFRRRSQDFMSVAKNAMAAASVEAAKESYFSLYRGDVNAPESKAKVDVRLEKLNELYSLSKILFDFIGPQEYGITDSEKLEIGLLTSLPLLKEIVKDLEEVQASDDAKSFIYFTKESHIYTLLNCILEGGIQTKIARNAIPELDYLSQICFELYESLNADAAADPNVTDPHDMYNYSIRITISPGCHTFDPLDVQLDSKHCIGCAPRRSLTPHADWKEVIETLRAKFHTVKLPKSFTAVNLSEKVPQEFVREAESEKVLEQIKPDGSGIAPVH
ncbi:hypothetical protein KC360_g5691 [Hortaea werneckii]|nr:hypothetical protein KC325_g5696 [Hortaea werneckii]KAI6991478.1 hypothetical protein KC359_g6217 [Hortaea werneckii]KAI7144178.1 hypothetical protein KC344_g5611 [Hortaea werneckii]KAI7172205.1 hypothetical protein KC360_g5691 [Hortaea werneckii]